MEEKSNQINKINESIKKKLNYNRLNNKKEKHEIFDRSQINKKNTFENNQKLNIHENNEAQKSMQQLNRENKNELEEKLIEFGETWEKHPKDEPGKLQILKNEKNPKNNSEDRGIKLNTKCRNQLKIDFTQNELQRSPFEEKKSNIKNINSKSNQMIQMETNSIKTNSENFCNLRSLNKKNISMKAKRSSRWRRNLTRNARNWSNEADENKNISAQISELRRNLWVADPTFLNLDQRPKTSNKTKNKRFNFFKRKQSQKHLKKKARENEFEKKMFLYKPKKTKPQIRKPAEFRRKKYLMAMNGLSAHFGVESTRVRKLKSCFDKIEFNLLKQNENKPRKCQTLLKRLDTGEHYRVLANYPMESHPTWSGPEQVRHFRPELLNRPFCSSLDQTFPIQVNLLKNSTKIFSYICQVSKLLNPDHFGETVFLTVEYLRIFLEGS